MYIKSAYTGDYSNRNDYLNSLSRYKPETFFELPIEQVASVRDKLSQVGFMRGQLEFERNCWNLNPNAMVVDDNMDTLSYQVYLKPYCPSGIKDTLKELGFVEQSYYLYTFTFFRGFEADCSRFIKRFKQKYGELYFDGMYR